ncbi:Required for respiratory growth protein 9 mitochondrial [Rhodotorula kratochvilovae]
MAVKTLLAPLLLLRSATRSTACTCAVPATRRFPSPRPFSSAPPAREQASWDSFDDKAAFKRATALPETPVRASRDTRNSRASRSPPSSSSRSPRAPRTPRKGSSPSTSEPPLPPLSPDTPVSALDPVHLHAYRLHLMQRLHRAPTDGDLSHWFHTWLRREYITRERTLAAEIAKRERDEDQRAKLDLAWEWERQAAEQAGLPRSDRERAKDAVVLERIARRKRAEREARERMRDVREVEALDRAREERAAAAQQAEDAARKLPEWKRHQQAMRDKFPTGWAPPKRLSREAMDLVRSLARSDPNLYSVPRLAERFKISPEAVRRILKSRFELAPEEQARREIRRKEARQKEVAKGGAPAWGGDLAAEQRELQALRASKKEESER